MGAVRTGDTLKDSAGFEWVLEQAKVATLRKGDDVELDLQDVTFISPYCMLGLLLLAQEVFERTGRALRTRNAPLGVCQYLERMNFFSGAGVALDCKEAGALDKFDRNPDSSNLLEITELLASDDDGARAVGDACTRLRDRVEGIMEAWTKNVKIDRFVSVLSETGGNVFEHSRRNGFVAIQRYRYKDGSKVTVSVADRGVGIRGSFADGKALQGLTDSAIIVKTVVDQLSSKRPKGAGLHQVLDAVKKARGGMLVRSGTGLFRVRPDGSTKAMDGLTYFPGTQVEVWLD